MSQEGSMKRYKIAKLADKAGRKSHKVDYGTSPVWVRRKPFTVYHLRETCGGLDLECLRVDFPDGSHRLFTLKEAEAEGARCCKVCQESVAGAISKALED